MIAAAIDWFVTVLIILVVVWVFARLLTDERN